jgi:hypothetical protein
MCDLLDMIGLLIPISTLQMMTVMKQINNPRIKDICEIEILLFGWEYLELIRLLHVKLFNIIFKWLTIYFSSEKARMTLWWDLAHFFNEDSIGKQTFIILTSVMIQSPRFKGTFFNL